MIKKLIARFLRHRIEVEAEALLLSGKIEIVKIKLRCAYGAPYPMGIYEECIIDRSFMDWIDESLWHEWIQRFEGQGKILDLKMDDIEWLQARFRDGSYDFVRKIAQMDANRCRDYARRLSDFHDFLYFAQNSPYTQSTRYEMHAELTKEYRRKHDSQR